MTDDDIERQTRDLNALLAKMERDVRRAHIASIVLVILIALLTIYTFTR